jgi:hypothetical protein
MLFKKCDVIKGEIKTLQHASAFENLVEQTLLLKKQLLDSFSIYPSSIQVLIL